MVVKRTRKDMDLDAECRLIFKFYFKTFVREIEKKYGVVGLKDVWRETTEHKRTPNKKVKKQYITNIILNEKQHQEKEEKLRNALHMMKQDDLFRHCVRNGIQPPHNRDDMIKAILARVL